MRKLLAALFVLFSTSVFAADSTVSSLTAASALTGPELFYCIQGGADRKCTSTQLQTFSNAWQTTGFQIDAVNPTIGDDANDRRAVRINCTNDVSNVNPGFTDSNCQEIVMDAVFGNNTYSTDTHSKTTFLPFSVSLNGYAAGQKIITQTNMNCYSMADCFGNSTAIFFAGGVTSGDEGVGFNTVSSGLIQQPHLTISTIASVPSQTTCATSTTQSITGSYTAQAVSVSSTTNCNINDWIMVDQIPNDLPTTSNSEAVQITSVGGGKINGVFLNNHSTSAPILPALVLNITDTSYWGQLRELVNLSAASYSTGTVSTITGHTFTGSGTSWATNMVGGTTSNIGCIALTADDYSGAPFDGSGSTGTLKSWYKILAVASATSLTIASSDVANNQDYNGKGPGSGGYIISPCSESMHQVGNNEVILESNTATWTTADNVELAISPYPDIGAYNIAFAQYNTGGTRRYGLRLLNRGARTFPFGIIVGGQMPTGSNSDAPIAYGTAFLADFANIGFQSVNSAVAGISLGEGGAPDAAGRIEFQGWGSGYYLQPNHTNDGFDIKLTADSASGLLSSVGETIIGSGTSPSLQWAGILGTSPVHFSALPTCASGLAGLERAIDDSNTTTFLATISAGGSGGKIKAYCDGTNWTVH